MKLGLCTISNKEWPVGDVVELAGEVGYDGVEIWGRDHVGDGTTATCRQIHDVAAACNVEIPVYGSYLRPGSDSFADELDEEVRIAADLGAEFVRVWPGSVSYGEHSDDHWEDAVADLSATAEAAAERGLSVTVEKHANTLTETAEGATRLVEEVDEPNCGLNWQPSFQLDADAVLADAEACAPHANNVHIQAPSEPGGSRCLLSAAHFDVPAVFGTLSDAGFDGYVEVEFVTEDAPYREAVRADRDYLQSVLEGV